MDGVEIMGRNLSAKADNRNPSKTYQMDVDDEHFFCIGCKKWFKKDESVGHHVVCHSDGGLSEKWNVLQICRSCHSIAHNGNQDDAKRLNDLFTYFMIANFGLLHLLQIPKMREIIRKEININEFNLKTIRQIDANLKSFFEARFFNLQQQ